MLGEDWGGAASVEEGDEQRGYSWCGNCGEGDGGGFLGDTDEDRYQEPVAGVQGVGEQGVNVACQGTEEAKDEDRTRDRDGYEVGEHTHERDLIEGGGDYG